MKMLRLIGLVELLCLGFSFAQTTEATIQEKLNAFEARLSSPSILELQYSRRWFSIASTDAAVQLGKTTFSLGVTLHPLQFLFVQGRIGLPAFRGEQALDGPLAYSPDVAYALRAGVMIRFRSSPLFVTLSGGTFWAVERNYCYTCGGFPPSSVMVVPKYRDETERHEIIALGFGGWF